MNSTRIYGWDSLNIRKTAIATTSLDKIAATTRINDIGDSLEDGANNLRRDIFFLVLDAERGDQRGLLLDTNHDQSSFAN